MSLFTKYFIFTDYAPDKYINLIQFLDTLLIRIFIHYIRVAQRKISAKIKLMEGHVMVRNRVKELRKERNLRQEELASRVNISQQTVSRIENGENALAADVLIALSNYFGVSVDYILCLTDSRRGGESQIEFNEILERNYSLCRRYEQLERKNQELIFNLTEELESAQRLKKESLINRKREKSTF